MRWGHWQKSGERPKAHLCIQRVIYWALAVCQGPLKAMRTRSEQLHKVSALNKFTPSRRGLTGNRKTSKHHTCPQWGIGWSLVWTQVWDTGFREQEGAKQEEGRIEQAQRRVGPARKMPHWEHKVFGPRGIAFKKEMTNVFGKGSVLKLCSALRAMCKLRIRQRVSEWLHSSVTVSVDTEP